MVLIHNTGREIPTRRRITSEVYHRLALQNWRGQNYRGVQYQNFLTNTLPVALKVSPLPRHVGLSLECVVDGSKYGTEAEADINDLLHVDFVRRRSERDRFCDEWLFC
jgi:hypothetical protein